MTISKTIGKSPRLIMMLTAGALLLGAVDAIAQKGGNSDNRDKMSNNSFKKSDHKKKHADKNKDKHKHKHKHKHKDETTNHPLTHPKPDKPGPVATPEKPKPAKPSPVVRDLRTGGKAAGLAPGTIIRDNRNGAGKPVVVVSSGRGTTVTRPATDAEMRKAGLLPKASAPAPIYMPAPSGR